MGNFLLRVILVLGIAAAIYFVITGGHIINLLGERGTKVMESIKESEFVTDLRERVKSIDSSPFVAPGDEVVSPGNEVVSPIEEEQDTSFFKQLFDTVKEKLEQEEGKQQDVPAEHLFLSEQKNLPPFTAVCFPAFKQVCTATECSSAKLDAVFTLLDKNEANITRCSSNGCETFDSDYELSHGIEYYQPIRPLGLILTKEAIPSDETQRTVYIEISVQGITTTIYSGYCLEQ